MKRNLLFILAVLLLAAPALAQVPNRAEVVNGVAAQHPQYLRTNTPEADVSFLQCVIAAMPEEWGFLSKDGGETGYTFRNGVRVSVDVIVHRATDRLVDIIGSSDNAPNPGSPTWNVIAPELRRPHNVFVSAGAVPRIGCTATIGRTRLGASLFWAIRGMRDYRAQLDQNLRWIKNELGADYVRVFMVLGGDFFQSPDGSAQDPWANASIPWRDREFARWMAATTDHIYDDFGLKVHWTLIGGRAQVAGTSRSVIPSAPVEEWNPYLGRTVLNVTPPRRSQVAVTAQSEQEAVAQLWLDVHRTRLDKVEFVEVWNEYLTNNGTAAELRHIGRYLQARLPAGFPIALSSPQAAHDPRSTRDAVWSEIERLYGGTSGASTFTYHASRPEPTWGPGADWGPTVGGLSKRNSESRGPGASAGGDVTDPAVLASDYQRSLAASEAGYVFHSKAGVWGGHCNGWSDQNTSANLFDHAHVAETARRLKSLRANGSDPGGGTVTPPPPVREYPDENVWWAAFELRLKALYERAGRDMSAVDTAMFRWFSRTAFDLATSLTPDQAAEKHLDELRAALGLPK